MKRSLILFLFFCLPLLAAEPDFRVYIIAPEPINIYLITWEAVKQVESKGDDFAVNEKEQAYGAGQIRQCKLIDYNRANNAVLNLQDCFDEAVSRKVWLWHCSQYSDLETICRTWNGGPDGMSKESTVEYWNLILWAINTR